MKGILFAVMAGVFISLQTVFNTRVSGKVGLWATTTLVLGLGFFTSFLMFIIMDDTRLFAVGNVNKVYLFGGFLGVGVVFCIMQAIRMLGPAYAISIVLVSQIFLAVWSVQKNIVRFVQKIVNREGNEKRTGRGIERGSTGTYVVCT